MNPDIFLSHSGAAEDQALIDQLEWLCNLAGLTLYVGEREPEYEKRISDKVKDKIDASRCLLALMTRSAASSQFVGNEIGYAESKIPIIMIVEEDVKPSGFRYGYEPVPFVREDPIVGLRDAVKYLKAKIVSGEFRTRRRPAEPLEKRKAVVLREAEARFAPVVEKRFASLLEVAIQHEPIMVLDTEFVDCRLTMKMELEPSDGSDAWSFFTFVDPRISRKLATLGASREPWRVNRVEVQGKPLAAKFAEQYGWRTANFEANLPPGSDITIEADYNYLCWPEDRYFLQLLRFARHVRFMYKRHPQFDYSAFETGGAAPLQPETPWPLSDVALVERKGLIFPGWGYLVEWKPRP